MTPDQAVLARQNLDRRLKAFKAEALSPPSGGWVRAIRQALGLTALQLARRMGTVQSRISTIEKAERSGATSLKTLREVAEAMGCTLVYAIVPTTSLDGLLADQVRLKVDQDLASLDHTMRLENQAVTASDLAMERERLTREMLAGPLSRVWQAP